MQKWENLKLPITIDGETILSALLSNAYQRGELILSRIGKEGWELVSVDNGVAYFKRPIDEAARNREKLVWSEEMGWHLKPLMYAVGKPLDDNQRQRYLKSMARR